jgi:hypothetical protein
MGVVITATPPGNVPVITTPTKPINITVPQGKPGPQGDPGPPGDDAQWDRMTQAQFDALPAEDKDSNTLYVIIG